MPLRSGSKPRSIAEAESLLSETEVTVFCPKIEVVIPDEQKSGDAAGKKRSRIIKGFASTPTKDEDGHVVRAQAWKSPNALRRLSKNPMLMYAHGKKGLSSGVGRLSVMKATDEGFYIEGRVNDRMVEGNSIIDMIDDGDISGLSARFTILAVDPAALKHKQIEVTDLIAKEVSLCAIPNNEDTLFEVAKSLDGISDDDGGREMDADTKLFAKSLALPETATHLEIATALQGLLQRANGTATVAKALGLEEAATVEQITEAVKAKGGNAEKELRSLKAEQLVEKYSDKVIPALKDFYKSEAEADPEKFEKWAKLAPVVNPGSKKVVSEKAGDKKSADPSGQEISKEDREVCEMFGAFDSPEDMLKMANLKPNEALEYIFGRKFRISDKDKEVLEKRRYIDERGWQSVA